MNKLIYKLNHYLDWIFNKKVFNKKVLLNILKCILWYTINYIYFIIKIQSIFIIFIIILSCFSSYHYNTLQIFQPVLSWSWVASSIIKFLFPFISSEFYFIFYILIGIFINYYTLYLHLIISTIVTTLYVVFITNEHVKYAIKKILFFLKSIENIIILVIFLKYFILNNGISMNASNNIFLWFSFIILDIFTIICCSFQEGVLMIQNNICIIEWAIQSNFHLQTHIYLLRQKPIYRLLHSYMFTSSLLIKENILSNVRGIWFFTYVLLINNSFFIHDFNKSPNIQMVLYEAFFNLTLEKIRYLIFILCFIDSYVRTCIFYTRSTIVYLYNIDELSLIKQDYKGIIQAWNAFDKNYHKKEWYKFLIIISTLISSFVTLLKFIFIFFIVGQLINYNEMLGMYIIHDLNIPLKFFNSILVGTFNNIYVYIMTYVICLISSIIIISIYLELTWYQWNIFIRYIKILFVDSVYTFQNLSSIIILLIWRYQYIIYIFINAIDTATFWFQSQQKYIDIICYHYQEKNILDDIYSYVFFSNNIKNMLFDLSTLITKSDLKLTSIFFQNQNHLSYNSNNNSSFIYSKLITLSHVIMSHINIYLNGNHTAYPFVILFFESIRIVLMHIYMYYFYLLSCGIIYINYTIYLYIIRKINQTYHICNNAQYVIKTIYKRHKFINFDEEIILTWYDNVK